MFSLDIILISAIIIEFFTVFSRFFLKLSSKKIYIGLMKKFDLKRFYHFHHLFLGLLIALAFYSNPLLFNIGIGVSLSDVLHHFVVLLVILKTPEFHIVYKNAKVYKIEEVKDSKKIKKFVKHIHTAEKKDSKKIKRFLKHIVHEVEDI